MVKYISIRVILDRLLRHPLLQELTLEQAIQYTVDFVHIMGLPKLYQDNIIRLKVVDYQAELPCNIVDIIQVQLSKNGVSISHMGDSFNGISKRHSDITYKTQGTVLHLSVPQAEVDVAYKSLAIDDEGFPMISDNSIFLKALESYIKKEYFTILFDLGKINNQILVNTQQEYSFNAGQCHSEFTIPTPSEMQSITNMMNRIVLNHNDFYHGFKNIGDKEQYKIR